MALKPGEGAGRGEEGLAGGIRTRGVSESPIAANAYVFTPADPSAISRKTKRRGHVGGRHTHSLSLSLYCFLFFSSLPFSFAERVSWLRESNTADRGDPPGTARLETSI